MKYIIFLIGLVFCQQITAGVSYFNRKFFAKIDTNLYYYYYQGNNCTSIHPYCERINGRNLTSDVDHTLDHHKKEIIPHIMTYIQQAASGSASLTTYYFREKYREKLDIPLDMQKYT